MVVIKPGNAKKPWSCDVTCPECAAELQVDEADLWRFVNCEILHAMCIECEAVLTLTEKDSPPRWVMKRLMEREKERNQ